MSFEAIVLHLYFVNVKVLNCYNFDTMKVVYDK